MPSAPTPSTSSPPPGESRAFCAPAAPGWEPSGLTWYPWALGGGGLQGGREGGVSQLSSPCTPHLILPVLVRPLPACRRCPGLSPAQGPLFPRGWAPQAALGEQIGSKTLMSSFRPCPFSPFLFLSLSVSPPPHLPSVPQRLPGKVMELRAWAHPLPSTTRPCHKGPCY